MAVYLIFFFTTRIGSLSSLVSVAAFVITDSIILIVNGSYSGILFLMLIGVMIFVAHKGNLKRLSNKNENVIDLKAVALKDVELINNIKQKINTKKSANSEVKETEQNSVVAESEKTESVEVVENENQQIKTQNKKRTSKKKEEVKAE